MSGTLFCDKSIYKYVRTAYSLFAITTCIITMVSDQVIPVIFDIVHIDLIQCGV